MEWIGFGLILCIGLAMFFQPIVRLHGSNGAESYNVFGLRSELPQLQSVLQFMATAKYSANNGASFVSVAGAPVSKPLPIPFSLRMAPLVQWFVFAALGFCLLALVDHFFFQKAVVVFSLLGGCAAAIAVLHLLLMGSDLRSWAQILMNAALTNTPETEDPSGLIVMTSSFFVGPGFGLYALTTCLFLVPFLSFTRAVPRTRSVVRHEPRVAQSQPIGLRPVNSRYPEENCTSVDVSKSGLLLESSLNHYYPGMEVYLTRNGRAGVPAGSEEHGSVVRVEKMQNGGCRIAIHLIPEG
jgi:hypothetical protein